MHISLGRAASLVAIAIVLTAGPVMADQHQVGKSPWGPDDEIGRYSHV